MEEPLFNIAYNTAMTEQEAAHLNVDAARNRSYWAVSLGLHPVPDGDKWCILWGKNLQDGVAAFGDTPLDAVRQFEVEMLNQRAVLRR